MKTAWPIYYIFMPLAFALFSSVANGLEVRDGHFYEAGQRVKFWGVHLSPGLSVSDYKVSDELAPRIRSMGFNAVAIWGIEEMFAEGVPESSIGDRSYMDRLDYLVHKCREAGLYVWFAAATRIPNAKISDYIDGDDGLGNQRKWHDALRKIQHPTPTTALAKHALYLDKGLQKTKLRFINQLLNHTNPYTGMAYKDHDGMLLYLSDENGFASNAAAIARYPNKRDAYTTTLLQREMIKQGGNTEAILNIASAWHRTLVGQIKSLAPQMLVNIDTNPRSKLLNLYMCKDADFCAYGTGGSQDTESSSMLLQPPAFNNSIHGSREFKLKGKPWIIYVGSPTTAADYRAEWPLRIAAFASYQDADGIFFWNWRYAFRDNNAYSRLPVYNPKYEADLSADEIYLSSAKLAGSIFINGYIPAAQDPITFTFGRRALLSWEYGYDWHTTMSFKAVQNAAYTSGSIIDLDIDRDIEFTQSRESDNVMRNPLVWESTDKNRTVTWDWERGLLIIDTPEAKAVTGFTGDRIDFNDGVSLRHIDREFISFALVAEDKKPINHSNSLTASLVSKSHNTGFKRDAQDKIVNAGSLPVIVERVGGTLFMPSRTLNAKKTDFSGRIFDMQSISDGVVAIKPDEPNFIINLTTPTPLQ